MKKLFVVLTMLAAMMLGMGAANATGKVPYPDKASCEAAGYPWVEGTTAFCKDSEMGGQLPEPVGPDNGTIMPNPGLTPEIDPLEPAPTAPAEPAPVEPPVEPYPAPPVEQVPTPVAVQPVPAPAPMPEGTAERVAAGEELAYTGAEDAALAGIAASVLSGGVALIWLARRMRTE